MRRLLVLLGLALPLLAAGCKEDPAPADPAQAQGQDLIKEVRLFGLSQAASACDRGELETALFQPLGQLGGETDPAAIAELAERLALIRSIATDRRSWQERQARAVAALTLSVTNLQLPLNRLRTVDPARHRALNEAYRPLAGLVQEAQAAHRRSAEQLGGEHGIAIGCWRAALAVRELEELVAAATALSDQLLAELQGG